MHAQEAEVAWTVENWTVVKLQIEAERVAREATEIEEQAKERTRIAMELRDKVRSTDASLRNAASHMLVHDRFCAMACSHAAIYVTCERNHHACSVVHQENLPHNTAVGARPLPAKAYR